MKMILRFLLAVAHILFAGLAIKFVLLAYRDEFWILCATFLTMAVANTIAAYDNMKESVG